MLFHFKSYRFLFNGNISSWNLKKDSTGLATDSFMTAYQYRYDVLNRITQSNYNKYSSSWQTSNNYKTRYKYDPNGNITGLLRNAYTPFITMDSLSYHFNSLTNQLNYVTDTVPAGRYPDDLDNQSPNNYLYDKIGNLNKDVSAGIDTVTWTVYGKLQSVVKTNGDTISYVYDASQNRVEKTVHIHSQNPVITYYVRDAQGNIISMYTRTINGSNYDYIQTEVPLYGSARLGEWKPNILVKTFPTSGIPTYSCISCPVNLWTIDIGLNNGFYPRKIFKKEYELDDHLGNVHTIVSDRKNADSTAFVISYNDYYPGGMLMPRRNYQDSLYTFGYNGKLKDNDIYGNANFYDYGARMYDPRLIRFPSPDPLTKKYPELTPYQFASNSPIRAVDLDGLESAYAPPSNSGTVINVVPFINLNIPAPNDPATTPSVAPAPTPPPAPENDLQKFADYGYKLDAKVSGWLETNEKGDGSTNDAHNGNPTGHVDVTPISKYAPKDDNLETLNYWANLAEKEYNNLHSSDKKPVSTPAATSTTPQERSAAPAFPAQNDTSIYVDFDNNTSVEKVKVKLNPNTRAESKKTFPQKSKVQKDIIN